MAPVLFLLKCSWPRVGVIPWMGQKVRREDVRILQGRYRSYSRPVAERVQERQTDVVETRNGVFHNTLQSHSSLVVAAVPHSGAPQSQRDQHLSSHQTLLELEHKAVSHKMKQLLQAKSESSWIFKHNMSDKVRWNASITHTYDPSFMLGDSTCGNVNVIINTISGCNDSSANNHGCGTTVPVHQYSSLLPTALQEFAQVSSRHLPDYKSESGADISRKPKNDKKQSSAESKPRVSTKNKKANTVVAKKVKKAKVPKQNKVFATLSKTEGAVRTKALPKLAQKQPIIGASVERPEPEVETIPSPQLLAKSKKIKKTKKGKKEQETQYLKEIRRKGREATFNQSLAAYLSVCVSLGMVNRATLTLLYYHECVRHHTRKDFHQVITSVLPYNIVLRGLAKKGDYVNMEKLVKCMKKDGIIPNETTFAVLLSCLGQHEESSVNTSQIHACFNAMKQQGIAIEDVFCKMDFSDDDSCEYILKATHRVHPSFNPQPMVTPLEYDCSLVSRLNSSLHSTKVSPPVGRMVTKEQLEGWTKEQLEMEACGEMVVKSIEKKRNSSDTRRFRKLVEEYEQHWRNVLLQTFTASIKMLKREFFSNHIDKKMNIYPYLVALPPEEYVNIMVREIERIARGSSSYSLTKNQLFSRLGEMVFSRYQVQYKRQVGVLDKLRDVYSGYVSWYLNCDRPGGETYVPRVRWQELAVQSSGSPSVNHCPLEWPNAVLTSIGKFMYSLILPKVMIWNPHHSRRHMHPAVFEVECSKGYRHVDKIKPSPALVELYEKAALPTLTFESTKIPMVCPPLPWVSTRLGGYLLSDAKFVRLPPSAHQQRERMVECGNQQLYPIMDSLNQLGSIPWKINQPMLDIIIQVFNDDGCEELDIPPPPSCCPQPEKVHSGMNKSEAQRARRSQLEYEQRKNEMHSLWCDALYKLSLANHFRERVFWFPHNMDFRGRVYPCPPHLNHLSSDAVRSVLQFARGEKLGAEGLWWLKLHLINLTGFLKRDAIQARIEYCESVLDDIFDSADRPLDGHKWWTKSDEPWQTLAACKELAAALRSTDPEAYVSHLPIHQDGSCNGLQHYAALGRDKIGATSVNLAPCDVPQDVYSDVAALVEKERASDAEKGEKIAQVLEGHIKRKLIKQTVMTTVYGVTRYGARLQIEKQLKALDSFPQDQRWAASLYLVQKTFLCLEKMFTSTKEIQNWFTDCAKIVCQTRGRNLEYVTPLGLPVVQPYSKYGISEKASRAMLPLPYSQDFFMQPNVMKQKNAFPPNFIHSLDSTHMMLTSLHCQRAGITFVAVHDCFWTHAPSVATLSKICREQFVALHQEPILEDLSRFLQEKFALSYQEFAHDGSALDSAKMKLNKTLRNVPPKGEFDITGVKNSTYFFS